MSPKKKPPNAIQKTIMTTALGFGSAKSNAPDRKSTANMATTIAGEPSRMASVSRLRTSVSAVRRVSTANWRNIPGRSADVAVALAA